MVSKTKYPFISQKNVVSWNENTTLVFARFFVEKRFSLELWIIPTRASTVFLQNNACSPGRFYHLLGEDLLLLTVRAISLIYWDVLSANERSVSPLSMHYEDTRYERWLFLFEFLPEKICTLLNVGRVSLTFAEIMQKTDFKTF